MRLPIIPFLIAATILGTVVYLFNSTGSTRRILDVPRLTRLADIDGIETEISPSPDGARCVVVSDGDLWMLNLSDSTRIRITQTPEAESAPDWSPDGRQVTFTRGSDTFVLPVDATSGPGELFKANATELSWSPAGRQTFIRDRSLWTTDVGGKNEKVGVPADDNPNVLLRAPRFSPDSVQIAYVKSLLNLSGQVWLLDTQSGAPRALVADRPTEDPLDVGWIMDGHQLVYLTNRSGSYALWHIDFAENTILPLTAPLFSRPLAPVRMGVFKDRIILPRHFADSNIALSDGTTVVQTENVELSPSVSRDGKLVAYTVLKENKSEVWTVAIDGTHPTFRAAGSEPRITADGFHLLYTHSDLQGNEDIWRVDLRNGANDQITDADEIDIAADPSPDARWIAFASTRGVAPSIWIVPASGGKRLRINNGGYGPRFSPDSRSILYWDRGAFWIMAADGTGQRSAGLSAAAVPTVGGWSKSDPLQVVGQEIRGPKGTIAFKSERPIWPEFDVMPDGRFVFSPVNILETGLWAIDLQFRNQ